VLYLRRESPEHESSKNVAQIAEENSIGRMTDDMEKSKFDTIPFQHDNWPSTITSESDKEDKERSPND
jgi:hypothetical protein